ncbi:PAS domain S-box protein [Hymenobacter humi]|uniref:PAS domain S-box protein n=1 Tax=Hymenobacter humi TaxID=1411620 RepID=A0ABW2UFD6_9BACT
MSLPPASESDQSSLAVENHALREEVRSLHAARQEARVLADSTTRRDRDQVRFQAVFEHSPLGHKIIGPDLTIRQANPAVAALLGLDSPAELLGRCIREFSHPAHHDDWAALQQALWKHRMPFFTLETRLLRADGADLWCRVTSVLIPDEVGELGFSTLEDITARKRLEERVQTHADAQYNEPGRAERRAERNQRRAARHQRRPFAGQRRASTPSSTPLPTTCARPSPTCRACSTPWPTSCPPRTRRAGWRP